MVCILFIHQNFPGQFATIAYNLSKLYDVHSMSFTNIHINGIPHHQCTYDRGNQLENGNLALEFESKVLRAKIVQDKCLDLSKKNIIPDVIIGHSGWGETLLLKNIWPNVKLISYMEFYYNNSIEDDIMQKNKLTLRNSPYLTCLLESDYCISPTKFQKDSFPEIFHEKIDIVFEGINTKFFKKKDNLQIKIGKLLNYDKWDMEILDDSYDDKKYKKIYNLNENDTIITFISRDLTPLRGYDTFIGALPDILSKYPDAYVLIVGNDGFSYCSPPPIGTYHSIYWDKIKEKVIDKNIFFLGNISQNNIVNILSITSLNIYISDPFCLSWSFMEALSIGVIMLTNNSRPMTDIIKNNYNGIIFEKDNLASNVINTLSNLNKFNHLKSNARNTVVNEYNYEKTILKYDKIIKSLL